MSFSNALIGDLTKIRTGKLDANAAVQGGAYPFFTCAVEPLSIDRYAYDCDAILIAGNGDLNVKHFKGKFEAYQRTYIIEVEDNAKLDSRYFYYFMLKYVEKLRDLSIGGVIKYIKLEMLTDAEIPLPPLEQQKRIAAILDKADAIRRKRQQAIKLADDFLRATFLDMFGDPVTNPKGWKFSAFEDIAQFKQGMQVAVEEQRTEEFENSSRFLRIINYTQNSSDYRYITKQPISRYVNKDDIIMVRYGATAGYIGRGLEGVLANNMFTIKPDDKLMLKSFLYYLLKLPEIYNLMVGERKAAAMPAINFSSIGKIKIYIPNLKRQQDFVDYLTLFENIQQKMIAFHNRSESNFKSLTQRAFRGEL